jgi:MFS transporter, DHA1 family, tetracycline resistance protein
MRSPLFPIFLTVFVDVLGLTLVLPLLPFYAQHFGASPFVVGCLGASYAACQLISGPILGRVSDRVGRKPTLIFSQLGTFAGFLMIGGANSLWLLFLGRILDGITAGNLTIAQAYISDVTKPENRTKAFAFIGIAFGMGFLLGPALSGIVAHRYGYSAPPFAAACLSALSVICTITLLPNVPPKAREEGSRALEMRRFFSDAHTRRPLISFFLYILTFSVFIGGNAMFLERRLGFDVEKVGYVFALSGLVGALVQGGLIGRLVKKLGEERLAVAGFVSMVIGLGLVGFVRGIPLLVVAIVISGFGVAVTRPSLTTVITKSVSRDDQGVALGLSQSLASFANIVGPLTAGALIDRGLLTTWALVAAVLAVIGALSVRLPPRGDEEPIAPPA